MGSKVGLAITTYNREEYLTRALASVPSSNLDELVVVNDGQPVPQLFSKGFSVIQHQRNLGVGPSKNDGIRYLLGRGCDHIFVMEDDMEIVHESIFRVYVDAARRTGIGHFNYGPGFAFNRHQDAKLGIHNQHLANYEAPLKKLLTANYGGGVSICFFPNLGGMFSYFSRQCLDCVGLMDENFFNVFEHVEHTYRISRSRFHPPFWWFADVDGSENYIVSQEGSMEKSSISFRSDEVDPVWQKRMNEGAAYFREKTGFLPAAVPRSSKRHLVEYLNSVNPRSKLES
jgi:glycosyltransferase involved in cell wall biosynthesis